MRVNDVAGNMWRALYGGVQQRGAGAAQPGAHPGGAPAHGRARQVDPMLTPALTVLGFSV